MIPTAIKVGIMISSRFNTYFDMDQPPFHSLFCNRNVLLRKGHRIQYWIQLFETDVGQAFCRYDASRRRIHGHHIAVINNVIMERIRILFAPFCIDRFQKLLKLIILCEALGSVLIVIFAEQDIPE